jgi:hypothetical protein
LSALSQASQPLSARTGQLLIEYALGPLRASHRYVLLTTLAANPDLTIDNIMMLWYRYRLDTVRRGLLRRLARHPLFPPGHEEDSVLSAEDLGLTRRIRGSGGDRSLTGGGWETPRRPDGRHRGDVMPRGVEIS